MEKEKWISVNEKLPKDNQVVKVKGKFSNQPICFFKQVKKTVLMTKDTLPCFFQIFGITHWQPVEKTLQELLDLAADSQEDVDDKVE